MRFFVVVVDGEIASYHITLEGAMRRAEKWTLCSADDQGLRRWYALCDGGVIVLVEH